VTLFQISKGGSFYREVHESGVRDRCSLHTRDREHAESLGRQLLGMRLSGEPARVAGVMRLGELAEAFVRESPMFLDNAAHTRADQSTRIAILRAAIGDQRDVRTLTENDVRQYEARRKAGGIRYGPGRVTSPVRQRSVQADVKLLKQMLYWACTRTGSGGVPWLERNPLEHVRVQGEHDVKRPVASHDRFEATLSAMQDLQRKYQTEADNAVREGQRNRAHARRLSWIRAEFALWLLEQTGRRRGAVMGLRWVDFDFATHRVTWRPEHDKKRKTWTVRYPEEFFLSVREFQRRLGAVGGYVFPRTDDSERPAPAELLSQWTRKAEVKAGLAKLAGGTCHPYRRKWRSERAHHPIKAVALAGGWTDFETMLRCYDQPDEADVLAVTAESKKRRDAPATCSSAKDTGKVA
jgi:integrase